MILPEDYYRQSISEHLTKIKFHQRKLVLLSLARLLSFVALIVFIALFASSGNKIWVAATLLAIVLFLFFLKRYLVVKAEKDLSSKLQFLGENENSVLSHQRNQFDNGAGHSRNAIFSEDLDIFGERSLFHFLNRTTTPHGSSRLAALLDAPLLANDAINLQQEAVKQLSQQPDLRQRLTARGLLSNTTAGGVAEINTWINMPGHMLGHSWLNIGRFILPVLNLAALLFFLDSNNPLPLLAGVVFSWAFIIPYSPYIHAQHTLLGKKQTILEQNAAILNEFHAADTGGSEMLRQLASISETGRHEVKRLSSLVGMFDQRLNLLVPIFLNSLFMYDIQVMMALEKWKRDNRNRFSEWMNAVAEIESLNSLATFAFNHPEHAYAELHPGHPFIEATELAHPLIHENEAVKNDIAAGRSEKLLLITGSNMSGKSTFLRTIGVNLLLAQCGAPVCARQFKFSPMQILSSIRISDSLQEHTSYFMAELKRLHQVIVALETGAPALVLIDEVLRGTNSNDKNHGSEALIKKLIRFHCLALFATHDLSLSELENNYPQLVKNYCFESRIENDELYFDYKLHRGVAINKNATFLMQKMGIIST